MDNSIISFFGSSIIKSGNLQKDIVSFNDKSAKYGLTLSNKDAAMLVKAGNDAVKNHERIEFGKSVTTKIIEKFMQSSYIQQKDYAETIAQLIDVFYYVKDQSEDTLTDDEAIDKMYNCFETTSNGSIELLINRDMERICRTIRNGADDEDNDTEAEDEQY